MPNRDKTGPRGEGPKTGRRLGDCINMDSNPISIPQPKKGVSKRIGKGLGLGRGLGRRGDN